MRVLIVEDDPRLANTIAEGLRDQGLAIDLAYDGHEAVTWANAAGLRYSRFIAPLC